MADKEEKSPFERMAEASHLNAIDRATIGAIESLKDSFGVETDAEVIREALKRARKASGRFDPSG
jgi:hypothetical protein